MYKPDAQPPVVGTAHHRAPSGNRYAINDGVLWFGARWMLSPDAWKRCTDVPLYDVPFVNSLCDENTPDLFVELDWKGRPR